MMASLALLVLGVAGAAQAQNIDCSGGCTETKYGLGADLDFREDHPPFHYTPSDFTGSFQMIRSDPNTAILAKCAGELYFWPLYGQMTLREQDPCVLDSVPDGSGCLVEIPTNLSERSGIIYPTKITADLQGVGLGIIHIRQATFPNFEGSVGERVLIGAGPQTKIVWDWTPGVDPTDALVYNNNEGLGCCQSTVGLCAFYGFAEYPLLVPPISTIPHRPGAPDWVFDGGAGTNWRLDPNDTVPGQEQGVCLNNRIYACNTLGQDPCPGLDADPNTGGLQPDVCDLRSKGFCSITFDLLDDGSPDPTTCNRSPHTIRGFPNQDCWIHEDLGLAQDPLPGCLLAGFGYTMRPDLDCDGVSDVIPDKCPWHSERNPFLDSNSDGVGDECQCGDTNSERDQDGILGFLDALAIVQTAGGVGTADFRLSDTDGNALLTFGDAFNVVQAVQGAKDATTFTCLRNP
jgi:hypothetical protein